MRILLAAALALTLAACGDRSEAPSAPASAIPEEWRAQLTDSPTVAATYSGDAFQASAPATVTPAAGGAQITTNEGLGAFSATLDLGPSAAAPGPKALRVTVQTTTGALQLVMTHWNFPAGYTPYTTYVAAGEAQTLYLPVDTNGAPVLIIANGSEDGPSTGTISQIELLTPPG